MDKKVYEIYQLPLANENIFKPYSKELEIDIFNYVGVYSDDYDSTYSNEDICEELYNNFNLSSPTHFIGHSMSISDIIRIKKLKDEEIVEDKFYYCDIVGFKEVTDKISKTREYNNKVCFFN